MYILVTGGAGFIGRRLVNVLVADGHQVRVLDNLSEQVHGLAAHVPAVPVGAEFVHGDIRDAACLAEALVDVEAVAHLAAETGVGQSMYEVSHYVDVNDRGTARLLQAVIESPRPMRIVLASSRAVYGEGLYHCQRCGDVSPSARAAAALHHGWWDPICPVCSGTIDPVAIHEAAQVNPGSIYAATKLSQEHLCRIIGYAYGIPITILRYFNVYGPGQSLSNPYTGILSTFYARATSGKAIEVYEDGQVSRDFVFIDDVVEATRRALISPGDQVQSRIVNVGTGVPVSIEALARTMLRLGGWDVPVRVTGAYRLGDVRHAFADTTRLMDLLGMDSFTLLGTGLRQWLQWAKGNDAHDSTDVAQGQLAGRGLYRHARDC